MSTISKPTVSSAFLVEKGQATAVVLEDGTVIKARKFIASNVNPVETFIKLVGRENLENKFADAGRKLSLFQNHADLRD